MGLVLPSSREGISHLQALRSGGLDVCLLETGEAKQELYWISPQGEFLDLPLLFLSVASSGSQGEDGLGKGPW